MTFPKSLRLLTPAEFKAVFDNKRSAADACLIIYALRKNQSHTRVGLSVSRKVGNAVNRNRWKRLLREAFRLQQYQLPSGWDFVIIPRSASVSPSLQKLQESMFHLMRRLTTPRG